MTDLTKATQLLVDAADRTRCSGPTERHLLDTTLQGLVAGTLHLQPMVEVYQLVILPVGSGPDTPPTKVLQYHTQSEIQRAERGVLRQLDTDRYWLDYRTKMVPATEVQS